MPKMDPRLITIALDTKGFMPPKEGAALYEYAYKSQEMALGPLVEIGSYCGKSTVYLGASALETGRVLFSVDHHRGSEENQAGWEHHDPSLVNPATNRIDTLSLWRSTIESANLEHCVIAIVGESGTVADNWSTPISFLFIDGGHGSEPAWTDYNKWTPHVANRGLMAIHDVFEDPKDGGRPPFEIYLEATRSGNFVEIGREGSLRILQKTQP